MLIRRYAQAVLCWLLMLSLASARGADAGATTKPVRVACVGDSITFGWGMKDPKADCYPTQMQQLLGPRYEVKNFGSPGASICPSSEPAKNPWHHTYVSAEEYAASLKSSPAIVVIALGPNDIIDWAAQAQSFVPRYLKLIESYRSLPTKPRIFIWHRIAPVFKGSPFVDSPAIPAINAALGTVAREAGVPTIDIYEPLKDSPELFMPDGVHPERGGAAVIARTVAAAIAPSEAKR